MKNKIKIISLILVCLMASALFVGCKKDTAIKPKPDGVKKGTINVTIPIGEQEKIALNEMVTAYTNENPYVTVNVNERAYETYNEWLSKQLAKDTSEISADIIVNNGVTQFFADEKFVDYGDYLSRSNPYANKAIWEDTLMEQAYRANGVHGETYNLNFESNQIVFFYNKQIFRNAGLTVDGTKTGEPKIPQDWDELVAFAKKISETKNPNSQKNYIPFTISGNTDSFQNNTMGWLIRVYADQYFRSIIEDVRAKEGDYCYNSRLDANWKYAPKASDYPGLDIDEAFQKAINNDSSRVVTTNDVRTMKLLMDGQIGPNTPQYKDLLTNLLKLIPKYTNENFFSCDQGTAIGYFWNQEAGIYFGGTDIYKAYIQLNEGRPENEKMEMATFNCPPMKHAGTLNGAPDIDITRGLGGPQGFYGVINKSQKQNDLCMDFMMYWASKLGQEKIFDSYKKQNWYINGSVFIKDIVIPDEIYPAKHVKFQGECDLNPIQLVARGLSAEPTTIREFQTLSQELFRNELTVENYSKTMQEKLQANISKYCALRGYNSKCYLNPQLNPYI